MDTVDEKIKAALKLGDYDVSDWAVAQLRNTVELGLELKVSSTWPTLPKTAATGVASRARLLANDARKYGLASPAQILVLEQIRLKAEIARLRPRAPTRSPDHPWLRSFIRLVWHDWREIIGEDGGLHDWDRQTSKAIRFIAAIAAIVDPEITETNVTSAAPSREELDQFMDLGDQGARAEEYETFPSTPLGQMVARLEEVETQLKAAGLGD